MTFAPRVVSGISRLYLSPAFRIPLNITAQAYLLPRSHNSLLNVFIFPATLPSRFPLGQMEFTTSAGVAPPLSHLSSPSGQAKLLERCSCASRGVDAAGGHVLGVAVKQASNDTPCNHSKGGRASPALTQEMLRLATG